MDLLCFGLAVRLFFAPLAGGGRKGKGMAFKRGFKGKASLGDGVEEAMKTKKQDLLAEKNKILQKNA